MKCIFNLDFCGTIIKKKTLNININTKFVFSLFSFLFIIMKNIELYRTIEALVDAKK